MYIPASQFKDDIYPSQTHTSLATFHCDSHGAPSQRVPSHPQSSGGPASRGQPNPPRQSRRTWTRPGCSALLQPAPSVGLSPAPVPRHVAVLCWKLNGWKRLLQEGVAGGRTRHVSCPPRTGTGIYDLCWSLRSKEQKSNT